VSLASVLGVRRGRRAARRSRRLVVGGLWSLTPIDLFFQDCQLVAAGLRPASNWSPTGHAERFGGPVAALSVAVSRAAGATLRTRSLPLGDVPGRRFESRPLPFRDLLGRTPESPEVAVSRPFKSPSREPRGRRFETFQVALRRAPRSPLRDLSGRTPESPQVANRGAEPRRDGVVVLEGMINRGDRGGEPYGKPARPAPTLRGSRKTRGLNARHSPET